MHSRIITPRWSIDEMPHLSQSLGKAGADRIRHHQSPKQPKGPKERRIANPWRELMEDREIGTPGCWVDDIIQGVARLDWQSTGKRSIPLNVSRLYAILQTLDEISTPLLMDMLAVEQRQAQKYFKAVKLIMFHIRRHLLGTSGSTAV